MTKSLILREQDERAVIKDLAMRLLNVAKLFTLDYSEESAVLLAQWVYKNYAVESLETVQKVLSNPPNTGEKVWRLTPDIITDWMAIEIEKQAKERERLIHNAKVETEVENEWTDERLKQWSKIIDKAEGFKRGPALSPQEIEEEGQEKPKRRKENYQTTQEEAIVKRLHIEWIRTNYDPITGKKKDGWMDEDSWIRLANG